MIGTLKSKGPIVSVVQVEAETPSLADNTGDLDRLKRCLAGAVVAPLPFLARVTAGFRQAGFKGWAVINNLPGGRELVDFLPARPEVLPAMALDLGTTHLEASLVDLLSGRILARDNLENAQMEMGADILSRIHFATRNESIDEKESKGLTALHDRIIRCINSLACRLADLAGQRVGDIRALSVSGNTTMVHFFLHLDPYHLCREPYIPAVNAPDCCRASDLQLAIYPGAPVWVLPGVGSYFGGDLIAGILASGMDTQDRTSMLIDVGTNAEVVIGNSEWLIACAGAAGPALEGGVARMGMRAGPGAVEHVSIDPETGAVSCRTIDNEPARGICGSGMIDLVAELYLNRAIDIRGKLRAAEQVPLLAGRLVENDEGRAFVVVPEEEAADSAVMLSQLDLDAMMRSKAAMYAILTTLINQVGLDFKDLHRIYVAGAFGRHISPKQAITLGMLPDLPLSTFEPVGNSSLAGAEMILLDQEARDRSGKVAGKITYVELNVNQEFMIRFSGSRFIPHTDHTLFPSVPYFYQS
jgi:uncharacterized 2Fe-2S/4Fe-4S cluster protein (DUF4445 family)